MKSVIHKNIILCYGYYQDPDQNFYIIMELADKPLDKLLNETSPDTTTSLNWATQVARGMAYLHYDAPQTILHGDLKSMNVLTFKNGVLKITDFGSAKYFDGTRLTSINFTCAWTAPELFKKAQKPNLACDVYSYGILLWEMVTHMKPFSDCDNLQIMFAVNNGDRPDIMNNCPDILKNLMTNCWNQDPKVKWLINSPLCMKCGIHIAIAYSSTLQRRPNFKAVVRTLEEAGEKEIF